MEALILCPKSFKIGYPQKCNSSDKSVLSTYLDIFSQARLKSGVWKTAFFFPLVFLDFSIFLKAI